MPQLPPDELGTTGQPRIGTDEWVASVEERRERRSGLTGQLLDRLEALPFWQPLLVVGVLAAIFPYLTDSDYVVRVGFNALVFALLALGLNIVVGYAGLLDLGYIAFFGFGAYTYAIIASNKFDLHVPTVPAVLIVIAASALLGLLLGLPSRRLSGDYLAIVTLFFAQIFVTFTTNANRITLPWSDEPFDLTGGPNGITGVDPYAIFGVEAVEVSSYFHIALVLVIVGMLALHILSKARTGRAWKAVREDPLAAEAMTIPVNRLKLLAFAFGAATAGLTGSLFAAQQIGVFPQNFELPLLITVYAMVILGGAGSIPGVVVGAIGITVALEVLRGPAEARLLFYGAILIGLAFAIRPWLRLAAVLAATVALGYVIHFVVGSLWPRSVARPPAEGEGLIGEFVESWMLLPTEPGTIGNVAFVVLVASGLGLTLIRPAWRAFALPPILYLAAFVWENRLIYQPSVTRLLILGALLVVLMNARPQGLFGTPRVEIV
ncbi:MAG TPA: branched-chain amino acid ABC transporter permease [Gaiellaceae bacterium]|nr:branched-chain amino acid ABC transporter permease [Gaiellaceae bacterium]